MSHYMNLEKPYNIGIPWKPLPPCEHKGTTRFQIDPDGHEEHVKICHETGEWISGFGADPKNAIFTL